MYSREQHGLIGRDTKTTIHIVVGIADGVLQLEMFKERAAAAIPLLEEECEMMADYTPPCDADGVEARDRFCYDLYKSLIQHLKQIHNLP